MLLFLYFWVRMHLRFVVRGKIIIDNDQVISISTTQETLKRRSSDEISLYKHTYIILGYDC